MSLQVNSFPLIITLVLHCSQLTFLYFVRKKKNNYAETHCQMVSKNLDSTLPVAFPQLTDQFFFFKETGVGFAWFTLNEHTLVS